ncbi:L-threonylcarbamoyladenylate synthase [Trueperella pyogenes]|uniref:L-threonylcarbamoyladenylate synthase n=1 Tax=Trueperella pyogenes TaxID=1661 RepID=UPI000F850A47|nr:L-threonylcarbamoyladenylate synthase [Trueperella pyogenes]AZR03032.1 threonylcarbamoyl-AMP synthase [Trueperella pyogenes]MDF2420670.1 L-threonylcarbamoyladenylate synthase [Trueperella pyogenes]
MKVAADGKQAIELASQAIGRGEVICLPTDTVYGIGADPRNAQAITRLLTAKSRTRENPPPVLVADIGQAAELSEGLPEAARRLMEAFWPGAMTIVVPARATLGWDLGETNGTVALRMPDSAPALALLRTIGPLAVTSANQHGQPPASTVDEAISQLGDAVSLYLDGGATGGAVPSTIVSVVAKPTILRHGMIPADDVWTVLGAAP